MVWHRCKIGSAKEIDPKKQRCSKKIWLERSNREVKIRNNYHNEEHDELRFGAEDEEAPIYTSSPNLALKNFYSDDGGRNSTVNEEHND